MRNYVVAASQAVVPLLIVSLLGACDSSSSSSTATTGSTDTGTQTAGNTTASNTSTGTSTAGLQALPKLPTIRSYLPAVETERQRCQIPQLSFSKLCVIRAQLQDWTATRLVLNIIHAVLLICTSKIAMAVLTTTPGNFTCTAPGGFCK